MEVSYFVVSLQYHLKQLKTKRMKTQTVKANGSQTAENLQTLGKTTYHYMRSIVKPLFAEKGIKTAKFVKGDGSYAGVVQIAANEVEKALRAMRVFCKQNKCETPVWE